MVCARVPGGAPARKDHPLSRVRNRFTTVALATVLGLVTAGGTAGTASAATALSCADFTYQEDAQAALRLNPADPSGLDADNDGIACESLPHRPVVTPPTATPTTPPTVAPTTSPTVAPTTTSTSTPTSAPVTTTTPPAVTTSPAVTAPVTQTKNCSEFATQALAQAFLLADPTDPSGLDGDRDGVACEDSFGTQDQQVAVIPNGAVRTGGLPPR